MNSTIAINYKTDYAHKFISNLLGISVSSIDTDYCEKLFDRLTLTHEVNTQLRDPYGNFEWSFDDAYLDGKLYSPHLDLPIAALRQQIAERHPAIKLEPLWPDGKKFAVCLTHDVDEVTHKASWAKTYRHLVKAIQSKSGVRNIAQESLFSLARLSRKLTHSGNDPLWHYEDWLKLEDRFGFKSSFFFFPSEVSHPHHYDCAYSTQDPIAYDGQRMSVQQMMRAIDESGWDVGLHGSYYSATQPGLLGAQRQQIAAALQHEIFSTRQHCLRYDAAITPNLQAEAGFTADSTQGYNRSTGFRAGTSFPYWAWNHQQRRVLPLLEVPLHIMDSTLFSPLFGYDEDRAIQHCLHLMDNVERVGGCLTLNWHPHYLDRAAWWNVYKTLLAEAHHRQAWGCSVAELHRWWIAREQRVATDRLELNVNSHLKI